jgi:ferredoxin
MKVCVQLGELPDGLKEGLKDEVEKNWSGRASVISPKDHIPSDVDALLTIGKDGKRPEADELVMFDIIDFRSGELYQFLFQVNAKLGMMTASNLMKSRAQVSPNDQNAKLSRRDLFTGLRGGFHTYSDAPFVFSDICDAKYGCRKCVESCPSKSISLIDGTIKVSESECNRVGICTAVCPVSAIQLPRFSEQAFLGLVHGLCRSVAPKRVLVLTCDASQVDPAPWMYVQRVKDVGVVGPRLLSLAAACGVSGFIVYCADGSCIGKSKAKQSVEAVKSILRQDVGSTLTFVEGGRGRTEINRIYGRIPMVEKLEALETPPFSKDSRVNYTNALRSTAVVESSANGLGLTNLVISDTCTLCGTCQRYCPHSALKINSEKLEFDSSRCTGCGYCVQLCPENSIKVEPLQKLKDLERRVVVQDEILNCARCGKPLDSARFLKRVAALVGTDDPMMKYCNSCKQHIAFQKLMQSPKK